MKTIFPSLLIIGVAAGLARAQVQSGGQDARFQLPVDPMKAPLAPGVGQASGGDLLMQQVGAVMARHQSVSGRVRYRVDLFGHQLVGEGQYLQQGQGDDLKLSLGLKTVVGERIVLFQQTCDAKYLWQYQDWGDRPVGEPAQKLQITRIDVVRVRQAIANHAIQPIAPSANGAASDLMFGGLSKLIEGLKRSFTYSRVDADHLDALPVWVATGSWRPEALTGISKELADQAANGQPLDLRKLPAQVPESIRAWIGQEDFFPYRIEYLRRATKPGRAGEGGELLPIVTVEFYELQMDLPMPIDSTNFVCQPGSADVLDATQSFIKQRLGSN